MKRSFSPHSPAKSFPVTPSAADSNSGHSRQARGARLGWRMLVIVLSLVAVSWAAWQWQQRNRSGERHLQAGINAVNAHMFSVAEREWLQGVREDPKFPGCHEQLGELYMSLLRPADAARYYDAASKLTPRDGEMWIKLGNAYRALGETEKDKAYAAYKKAAALLPDNAEAQGEFGIFGSRRKDNIAAVKALRRAYTLSPNHERYTMALVAVESDADDYEAAETHLRPYLKLHPDDTQANYFMAVIVNQKPRTPENLRSAIEHAERALPAMRNQRIIYSLLGLLYLDARQPAKALKAYQSGQQIEPFNETLYSGMMRCYALLGDKKKQRETAEQLQQVVAHDQRREYLRHELNFHHKNVEAALELALLWEKEGNYEAAASTLKFATNQLPGNAKVRNAAQAFVKRMQARQMPATAR